MDDKAPALDTAEVLNLAIAAEKKSLDEKRAELHSASRDVIKSYKRYSRAKDKVAVKKSTRNLMRLEKSETELGMYIDGYAAAKERMQGALDAVVKAYEKYLEALCLSEDFGSAKKASRGMDSYVKRIERYINKEDNSVVCISSFYTLSMREPKGETDAERAQKSMSDVQSPTTTTSFVHTNEVEVSPVSIDISPTVERAVERAIEEFSSILDKRIAALDTATEYNAAALSELADKIAAVDAAISGLLANLDKAVSNTGVPSDGCPIIDVQESCTDGLQDVEVEQTPVETEQTPVETEQTELIEAQQAALEQSEILIEAANAESDCDNENG